MIFTKNNALVKIWVDNIQNNLYSLDQIPNLFNLKEIVVEVLYTNEKY